MNELNLSTTYYKTPGKENTKRTMELARDRIQALGIKKVVVATTSGETGALAASRLSGCEIIAVTHSTGFTKPNYQELQLEHRSVIESAGGKILTVQHAFGGVNRAVRRKLDTFLLDEIIAYTLRIYGQGMKVIFEIALMAADAGLVRTDEPILVIAGTGKGADTAIILIPSNAQNFFDLVPIEIICIPSPAHPAFTQE